MPLHLDSQRVRVPKLRESKQRTRGTELASRRRARARPRERKTDAVGDKEDAVWMLSARGGRKRFAEHIRTCEASDERSVSYDGSKDDTLRQEWYNWLCV